MGTKTNEVIAKYDEFFGEISVEEVQVQDNLQMHASMDAGLLASKV